MIQLQKKPEWYVTARVLCELERAVEAEENKLRVMRRGDVVR